MWLLNFEIKKKKNLWQWSLAEGIMEGILCSLVYRLKDNIKHSASVESCAVLTLLQYKSELYHNFILASNRSFYMTIKG